MVERFSPAGTVDGGLRGHACPLGMVPGHLQRGVHHCKQDFRLPHSLLHHPAAVAAAHCHPILRATGEPQNDPERAAKPAVENIFVGGPAALLPQTGEQQLVAPGEQYPRHRPDTEPHPAVAAAFCSVDSDNCRLYPLRGALLSGDCARISDLVGCPVVSGTSVHLPQEQAVAPAAEISPGGNASDAWKTKSSSTLSICS